MQANCAIDFYPSSFSSRGPQLMGLNAANEGFLDGFVRHARVDGLFAHTRSREEFAAFGEIVGAARGAKFPFGRIAPGDNAALGRVGALLHPFPGFGPLAWSRRFGDPRAYSLLGITHTTATHAVMDSIGNLLVAPIEPWDAVVCTSAAVRIAIRCATASTASAFRRRCRRPAPARTWRWAIPRAPCPTARIAA